MKRQQQLVLNRLSEVERALLRHLAQHRYSIGIVLRRLFRMTGSELAQLLAPLLAKPDALISTARMDGTEIEQFALTDAGVRTARLLGEHPHHSGSGSPRTQSRDLSMLWYCTMGEQRFEFLDGSAVHARFGDLLPSSPHAVVLGASKQELERLYAPSPRMLASDVARHVSLDFTRRALAEPEVRAWIAKGTYRITLLVDDAERRAELQRAIERRLLDASVPVQCVLAPAPRSLSHFVDELRAQKNSPAA